METIDIDDLKAGGYVEDCESRKRFEGQCFRENIVFFAGVMVGFIYAAIKGTPLGLWFSLVVSCILLLNIWRQYSGHVIDKITATPMLKFKNAHPGKCVIMEVVYVCRERKTYFRRIWCRVGEF